MTLGEDRVRRNFNPSANSEVEEFKIRTAQLIDLCQSHRIGEVEAAFTDRSERERLWALAQTHYETAAMWAVKAATFGK